MPNVLKFNGTSAKVEVPYSAELNPTSFTVEVWAKVMGGAGNYRSPITCRDGSPQRGYMLYAANNNLWWPGIGTGTTFSWVQGPPVELNKWTHVAGTYNGQTNEAVLYVNGHWPGPTGGARLRRVDHQL